MAKQAAATAAPAAKPAAAAQQLAIVPAVEIDVPEATMAALERLSATDLQLGSVEKNLRQAFAISTTVAKMREIFSNQVVKKHIMALAGTSIGFQIAEQGGQRPPDNVVIDCSIEAILHGASLVGNEFNVLGNRCYLTRAYFIRKLGTFPGLADLRITPGLPRFNPDQTGAIVKMAAAWTFKGKPYTMEREIAVRVNRGQGADAILGKADRKMRAAIYNDLTGSWHPDGELDDGLPTMQVAQGVIVDDRPALTGAATAPVVDEKLLKDDTELRAAATPAEKAADRPPAAAPLAAKASKAAQPPPKATAKPKAPPSPPPVEDVEEVAVEPESPPEEPPVADVEVEPEAEEPAAEAEVEAEPEAEAAGNADVDDATDELGGDVEEDVEASRKANILSEVTGIEKAAPEEVKPAVNAAWKQLTPEEKAAVIKTAGFKDADDMKAHAGPATFVKVGQAIVKVIKGKGK
jgi:hypothetical protein